AGRAAGVVGRRAPGAAAAGHGRGSSGGSSGGSGGGSGGGGMTLLLGISLAGRDVLLVGGGEVTARRMRRFLDEGAVVRVVAPQLHPETARLVRAHAATWHPRRFRSRDLAGVWLSHVATGDSRTDARIAALCARRRVLCVCAGDGERGSARMTAQLDAGDVTV